MSLADEIKLTIIERGQLPKSDIQRLWGVSDDHYRALQDEFGGIKVPRAGPKGTVELFSHADLEQLLGDLVYTVRRSRQKMTDENRCGSKKELAAALVIQHGVDLLRDTLVRKLVAKKCRVTVPGGWRSCKGARSSSRRPCSLRCSSPAFPRRKRRPTSSTSRHVSAAGLCRTP